MKNYSKIIFVCTANTYLSPVAEAMYRQFTEKEREHQRELGQPVFSFPPCCSRGLVVLFSEPISPKVNVSLSQHDLKPCSHENSVPLEQFDITPDALVLMMTFSEKVAYLEKYEGGEVYTLGEYVGVDTDIVDPYGGEDEQYDLCYHEIGRRIRKVIQILMENEKDEGGQAE